MHSTPTWSAEWTTDEPNALVQALRRWWRERRTVATLQGLDDATLKDIGVHRGEIPWIACGRCAAGPGRS